MTPAQDLLDQVLATTYTLPDALSRLRTLKDLILLELFGHGEQPNADKAPESTGKQPGWFASLGKEFFHTFTRENVYKIFDEMEVEVKKIQPLVMYLPFELPDEEMEQVGQHLRQLFGKRFLVDIKFDSKLIAGTALVWGGVYKDYSLHKKMEDNRQTILNNLKGFLKH